MADNVLSIILRYLVDKGSEQQAKESLSEMGKGAVGTTTGAAATQPNANIQTSIETGRTVIQLANKFNMTVEQVARNWAGMWTVGGKEEQQILTDVAATQDLVMAEEDAAAASEDISKGMGKVKDNTLAAGEEMRKLMRYGAAGAAGFGLSMVGTELVRVGKSLTAPIDAYIKFVGSTTSAGLQWATTQRQLEQSTIRIGGAMVGHVLPALKIGANLASKLADMFEKYPALTTGVAGVAGFAVIGGTLLQTVGQMLIGFSAIKGLLGLVGVGAAGTAATGAGATAVGGGFAAASLGIIPAVVAAVIAYIILHNINIPGQKESIWQSGTQAGAKFLATAAGGVGQMVGGNDTGLQWFLAVGEALGVLGNKAKDTANKINEANMGLSGDQLNNAVKMYLDYQKQETDATKQAEENRLKIIEDGESQIVKLTADYGERRASTIAKAAQAAMQAEQDYQDNRTKTIRDAAEQAAKAEQDYKDSRTKTIRDSAEQAAKAEQDYQEQRIRTIEDARIQEVRLEEDHQERITKIKREGQQTLDELGAAGDALGYAREKRRIQQQIGDENDSYNAQKRRAAEDLANRLDDQENSYNEQKRRAAEDLVNRLAEDAASYQAQKAQRVLQLQQDLADQAIAYQKEQERRAVELKQTLADEEANFQKERRQAAIDQQKKLIDLQNQANEERRLRIDAYYAQLADLGGQGGFLSTMQMYYQQYYAAVEADMKNAIARITSQTPALPGRAYGGYMSGLYRTGEKGYEYALDHPTTRVLEQLAGRKLTQERILTLAAGGTRGGNSIMIDQSGWNVSGPIDEVALMRKVKNQTYQAIVEVMPHVSL